MPDIELTEKYKLGGRGFWPSFTSTSVKKKIAKDFCAKDGGVIFIVKLDITSPHPHIKIPSGWSKYNREEEVLLLPYFALKVTKGMYYGGKEMVFDEKKTQWWKWTIPKLDLLSWIRIRIRMCCRLSLMI